MDRGIDRKKIFISDKDRINFLGGCFNADDNNGEKIRFEAIDSDL